MIFIDRKKEVEFSTADAFNKTENGALGTDMTISHAETEQALDHSVNETKLKE